MPSINVVVLLSTCHAGAAHHTVSLFFRNLFLGMLARYFFDKVSVILFFDSLRILYPRCPLLLEIVVV
ncbi:hypothetical protein PGB90_005996 [Kerria lacca]